MALAIVGEDFDLKDGRPIGLPVYFYLLKTLFGLGIDSKVPLWFLMHHTLFINAHWNNTKRYTVPRVLFWPMVSTTLRVGYGTRAILRRRGRSLSALCQYARKYSAANIPIRTLFAET